ncbi:hypothetical protein C8J57DRAFT_1489795 [Mycena rebaudengoi]|nr:hypothetical protein C8J57DRAFT_1489795 [Mycena rebaudengoi]
MAKRSHFPAGYLPREVERLDVDLYRSKTLWLPARGRGVFGGFWAALLLPPFRLPRRADSVFVERLRDGRSYLTRAVRARQHGQIVFMMMCSFQKEEPWQPTQQWRMPLVPPPNECQLEEERVADCSRRTMSTPGYARYITRPFSLSAASRTLGLERFGKGPNATGMMRHIQLWGLAFICGKLVCIQSCLASVDLLADDVPSCGFWALHRVWPAVYQSGTLIAVTTQEGVVRADRRAPEAKVVNRDLIETNPSQYHIYD